MIVKLWVSPTPLMQLKFLTAPVHGVADLTRAEPVVKQTPRVNTFSVADPARVKPVA